MKKTLLNFLFIPAILFAIIFTSACKKDKTSTPQAWVATYSNITLGDQKNYTAGHFFKPQTGAIFSVENAASEQANLAMLFFTESGGANTFLTFPADGTESSTFGTSAIRLFTQSPGGIDYWASSSLNSGMIDDNVSMTVTEFDALMASHDWATFDKVFKAKNNGKENLAYKMHYVLSPSSAEVYLLQFNGLVRAIMCVRSVVPASANGGSIRFDIIVEGREIYNNTSMAKNIQPLLR